MVAGARPRTGSDGLADYRLLLSGASPGIAVDFDDAGDAIRRAAGRDVRLGGSLRQVRPPFGFSCGTIGMVLFASFLVADW